MINHFKPDVASASFSGRAPARRLNVLLVCDAPASRVGITANALFDHVRSFDVYSRHRMHIVSEPGGIPDALDLDGFDVVLIHWSIFFIHEHYFSAAATAKLTAFRGVKGLLIQDEYRELLRLYDKCRHTGIDLIFSCLPAWARARAYPPSELPTVSTVELLTGYVPAALCHRAVLPIADRSIDVFYRGRTLPFWLGRIGQEKSMIAERFGALANASGLRCDLAAKENERIYGEAWIERLAGARAVLGVESACGMLDADGSLQKRVEAYMAQHPAASFDACEAACFPGRDGEFPVRVISPRVFEAVALRTPLVLIEGDYSGRLLPHRHYIPLRRDFSNAEAVLAHLRQHDELQAMADRAYREVALAPENSYVHMLDLIDTALTAEIERRGHVPAQPALTSAAFHQFAWPVSVHGRARSAAKVHYDTFPIGASLPAPAQQWARFGQHLREGLLVRLWSRLPIGIRTHMKRPMAWFLRRLKWL